jgi:hypothetical protein
MKNNPARQPSTEQLATLTARLVGAGMIPKLEKPDQMFHLALEYWRSCDNYLTDQQEITARSDAGPTGGPMEVTVPAKDVPKPPGFPVEFQWILNNLFDGNRDQLRDYIKHCQAANRWAAGDVESFIEPLAGGTDVESYYYLTRHWHEWRQIRASAARNDAEKKRPITKAKKKAATKTPRKKSGRPAR